MKMILTFSLMKRALQKLFASFITVLSPQIGNTRWQQRDIYSAIKYQENEYNSSVHLIDNYIHFNSLKNVLEVGSNSGPNIISLAKKYKKITFTGIDINASAINLGNAYAKQNRLANLRFVVLDITNPNVNSDFTNQYFDLIFTFATLMYVHPKHIRKVLRSLVQASAGNLIFVEQFDSGIFSKLFSGGRLSGFENSFKRNYIVLLEETCSSLNMAKPEITIYEVDPKIWSPGGGNARVIKVVLSGAKINHN